MQFLEVKGVEIGQQPIPWTTLTMIKADGSDASTVEISNRDNGHVFAGWGDFHETYLTIGNNDGHEYAIINTEKALLSWNRHGNKQVAQETSENWHSVNQDPKSVVVDENTSFKLNGNTVSKLRRNSAGDWTSEWALGLTTYEAMRIEVDNNGNVLVNGGTRLASTYSALISSDGKLIEERRTEAQKHHWILKSPHLARSAI